MRTAVLVGMIVTGFFLAVPIGSAAAAVGMHPLPDQGNLTKVSYRWHGHHWHHRSMHHGHWHYWN